MCIPTVCFLSLSTTTTGLDSLIEQTGGLHLKHFLLKLCCLLTAEQCVLGMLFSMESNGKQPGVYTSWAECSEYVLGYSGSVHKYSSYDEAMAAFNSPINSTSTSSSAISYKTVVIFFLCALVCAMWIKMKKCNGYNI